MDNIETRTLICEKCHNEFQVGRGINGAWLRRRFCPNCSIMNKKFKDVICKYCGKTFQVGRTADGRHFINREVCDDCLKPAETKTLICQKCGKKFTVTRSKNTGALLLRKTCFECDNSNKDYKIAYCATCGKEFKQYRVPYGGFSESKYCSYECGLTQEKTKKCKICGKEFKLKRSTTTGSFLDNVKYCSDECAQKGWEIETKKTCQKKYGVDYPCFTKQCIDANFMKHSKINEKFGKLLSENDIKYIDDYSLGDYFYDFYLPEQNVLIEINPTFTHTCIDTGVFPPLDKNYHKDKTKFATDNKYHCINIWDWDSWDDIIKLVKPKQKLYARKLKIKTINRELANSFIELYHIQGKCNGNTINIGLFYNELLVQVMTFGNPRYNKNYEWELLRLCSHSDYIIVGGAEKLFKWFEKEVKPNSVISYCDISKFSGNVYTRLGFSLLRNSIPSKCWSNGNKYITDNLLRQRGYDQLFKTNYGKGTSNEQLMLDNGWLPIYDCGQNTYVKEY